MTKDWVTGVGHQYSLLIGQSIPQLPCDWPSHNYSYALVSTLMVQGRVSGRGLGVGVLRPLPADPGLS